MRYQRALAVQIVRARGGHRYEHGEQREDTFARTEGISGTVGRRGGH